MGRAPSPVPEIGFFAGALGIALGIALIGAIRLATGLAEGLLVVGQGTCATLTSSLANPSRNGLIRPSYCSNRKNSKESS